LHLCSVRYNNCVQCMRDPYCGWNRESGQCQSYRLGLLQDPAGTVSGLCDASTPRRKIIANFGQSVHLPCSLRLPDGGASFSSGAGPTQDSIDWQFQDPSGIRRHVRSSPSKHVFTQDQGLVIIGVSEMDVGRYDCRLGEEIISSYQLRVDAHTCLAPNKTADYQKVYSDWCHEFQKYKNALKTWEDRQEKCGPPPPVPGITAEAQSSRNEIFQTNPFQ
jgi:hypothetical protein